MNYTKIGRGNPCWTLSVSVYPARLLAYRDGIIEPQTLVQTTDGLHIVLPQVPRRHIQVLSQPPGVVAFWDHRDIPLSCPPQQNLCGSLLVLLCELLDHGVLKQWRCVFGLVNRHIQLEERLRAKRTVGCDDDSLTLGEIEKPFLSEVGMMFDLESGRFYLGVSEEIQDQLAVEIADPDRLGETFIDQCFHGLPGFLNRCISRNYLVSFVGEARGISYFRIHVLQRDWKVDDVKIKIVNVPVLELLLANGLDLLLVMEGVPELGDDEELFSLNETILDRSRDTLAALDLVAVV